MMVDTRIASLLMLLAIQCLVASLAVPSTLSTETMPTSPKYGYCTNKTNCGNYSCSFPDYSNDFIAWFTRREDQPAYVQFYNNFAKAVGILRNYSGVITDDYYVPHMTVEYMCCYNPIQFADIIDLIDNYQWKPFNLTFTHVTCNNGGDDISDAVSIIIMLDQQSQSEMAAFVEDLENYLKHKGIPIHRPRSKQELFHSTLGVVESNYPVAEVMAQINQAIPIWNTIPMKQDTFWSFFPPFQFSASP